MNIIQHKLPLPYSLGGHKVIVGKGELVVAGDDGLHGKVLLMYGCCMVYRVHFITLSLPRQEVSSAYYIIILKLYYEAVWDIPTRLPLSQGAHRGILEPTLAERTRLMEKGFWIFMLVMDFLLPLIMVVFGKLFQHCPEEINSVFGYRTRRSMASQEAWN